MKKLLLFVVLFSVVLTVSLIASSTQDVVYLKNGSIIRGTITELIPDQSVKIETADGSVFVYSMKDVKKIKKEKAKVEEDNDETATETSNTHNYEEKNFALMLNPLGFLQFGPQLDFEVKVIPDLHLVGMLRWHGGGVLSYVLTPDLQPGAMAFGGGIRYFFRLPNSPGAFYTGFCVQYGEGTQAGTKGDFDSPYTGNFSYAAFAGEFGYRWNYDPMLISLGLLFGGANTLKSTWWYNSDPSSITTNTPTAYVFGMFELSFGFQF